MELRSPAPALALRRPWPRGIVSGLVVAAAVVGLYVSTSGYADDTATPGGAAPDVPLMLPSALGTQAMAWSLTGSEALAQVEGLHIGRFTMSSAEVAGYGPDATVWVARMADVTPQVAVRQMQRAIARGDTPFGTPVRGQGAVWSTDGAGQRHSFFASDDAVWWLSADASSAPDLLSALLREARP
jgi:hypothetical protein